VWPVSAMCLILGFMICIAWVSEENIRSRFSHLDPNQQNRVTAGTVDLDALRQAQAEVTSLRAENTKAENVLAQGRGATQLLNDSLQQTKAFAGLTPVEGPGVTVTLRDSPHPEKIKVADQSLKGPNGEIIELENAARANIHDTDVLQLVNELFAAGAEAISVNDHRLAGPTSIRCVGPTILVDDIDIASPVVVRAIGDPKTLLGALNLNGGVLSDFRAHDPDMVEVEEAKYLKLEPYSGRTNFRVAKVPKEK